LTEDDRDYKIFDWMLLPIFCASMMSLFEGNQQILNLYSETDKPQNFFLIALVCILVLTFLVAATVGYLGYLAFGNSVKSVVLYSLPNDDGAAITAKICYLLTIMGSFTIIIQPIFYVIESSNWYKYITGGSDEDQEQENETKDKDKGDANKSVGNESELLDGRPASFCSYVLYFLFRTLVVIIVVGIAFLIPNLSILITFCGAVLGTIVNILLPVLFYNRAYNNSDKNRALEMAGGDQDEAESLMNEGGNRAEDNDDDDDDKSDNRLVIKIVSWIVLAFGTVIGIWGLAYVIY